jgi:protocatechuate 3,4-dioxygenase, alpha subunit
MRSDPRLIPSGSQTVGPYFRIGLECLIGHRVVNASAFEAIEIRGQVLDRDGAPVSDALLEFWCADSSGTFTGALPTYGGHPAGFYRVATELDGSFSLQLNKPGASPIGDGRLQAPHMLVLVFARGLLRHLITRIYFDQEPANALDPVLLEVPIERRQTLIARSDVNNSRVFHWNVLLQGDNETAFFAW